MFSFRTTPIEDQLDKSLHEGKVAVFCTQSCWNADSGRYLYEIFRERGNLAHIYRPEGEHIPFDPDEMKDYSAVVVEIQDTGSRFSSYTVDALRLVCALSALGEDAPSLFIIDHINPAGREVEGTLPAGESDIWTPKVAHRHGLTLGELIYLYYSEMGAGFPLHIISAMAAPTSLLPWAIPASDDFAGMFTPYFYTGGCMWKDTNINPGEGTARPYEFIGAPFLKPDADPIPVPEGVLARPCSFTPLSGVHEGEKCFGYQLILLPGAHYHSLLHTVTLMKHFSDRYSSFHISDSLFTRLADPVIAEYLKGDLTFDVVEEHVKSEEQKWIRKAKRFLLYDDQPFRIK